MTPEQKVLVIAELKKRGLDEKLIDKLELGEIKSEEQVPKFLAEAYLSYMVKEHDLGDAIKVSTDRAVTKALATYEKNAKKKAEKEAEEAAAAENADNEGSEEFDLDPNKAKNPEMKAVLQIIAKQNKMMEDMATKQKEFGDSHSKSILTEAKKAAILARYPKNEHVKKNLDTYVSAMSATNEGEFDASFEALDIMITGGAKAATDAAVKAGDFRPVEGSGKTKGSMVEAVKEHAKQSNEAKETAENPEVATIPGMKSTVT